MVVVPLVFEQVVDESASTALTAMSGRPPVAPMASDATDALALDVSGPVEVTTLEHSTPPLTGDTSGSTHGVTDLGPLTATGPVSPMGPSGSRPVAATS